MTLYERLIEYCLANSCSMPSPIARSILGELVAKYTTPSGKVLSTQNDHTFLVNDYAEEYYPTLDYLISKYIHAETVHVN